MRNRTSIAGFGDPYTNRCTMPLRLGDIVTETDGIWNNLSDTLGT